MLERPVSLLSAAVCRPRLLLLSPLLSSLVVGARG